jgi:hypothetical protein
MYSRTSTTPGIQDGRVLRGAGIQKEGRTIMNSYLVAGSGDNLATVLNKEMLDPIPYTIDVAPGGVIVYHHTGVIDCPTVENVIVDKMNPLYSPGAVKAVSLIRQKKAPGIAIRTGAFHWESLQPYTATANDFSSGFSQTFTSGIQQGPMIASMSRA